MAGVVRSQGEIVPPELVELREGSEPYPKVRDHVSGIEDSQLARCSRHQLRETYGANRATRSGLYRLSWVTKASSR
jgi:hypothetical protein